ncbi:predicted protein [Streptomyces sp. SPB78]|nr:predicted protein [Streptomyces sp. SPB78]
MGEISEVADPRVGASSFDALEGAAADADLFGEPLLGAVAAEGRARRRHLPGGGGRIAPARLDLGAALNRRQGRPDHVATATFRHCPSTIYTIFEGTSEIQRLVVTDTLAAR